MNRSAWAFVVAAATAGSVVVTSPSDDADAQQAPSVATIYTANSNSANASALDGDTIARVTADIATGAGPESVAVAHNGLRAYVGNASGGSLAVIDTATNQRISTVPLGTQLDAGGGIRVADIVVSPDDTRVFAAIAPVQVPEKAPRAGSTLHGSVSVIDTVSLTETETFPLQRAGVNGVEPLAIDVSPDGSAVFVLGAPTSGGRLLEKVTQSSTVSVSVSALARELKVSADGSTVIVVGDDAPQFLAAATLVAVVGPSIDDIGSQLDLAVAGANVFVLNAAFAAPVPPVTKTGAGGPKGMVLPPAGPSIDVYDASTGEYSHSIGLGAGTPVLGIAVLSDGTRGFVTREGSGSDGSVTSVQLGAGTLGPIGTTGASPRRVAVKEAAPATPVVSYFLPRNINLKLKGAGKDSLIAAGFYDDGGPPADYGQPVTLEVGSFTKTFTLIAKGSRFVSPKDPALKFFILPNLRGSSRGRFKMILSKTTLAGRIDPLAAVAFHFRATGMPDAQGSVLLTSGRYKLGKKRGALALPQFFPQRAAAKVGGASGDSLSFVGGFATNGVTPSSLATVRFGFGPSFVRVIQGSQFTQRGDTFTFKAKQGAATFSIRLDFLRETVTVSAKKVELGPLDSGTVDVLLDAGTGAGGFVNTVRVSSRKANRFY